MLELTLKGSSKGNEATGRIFLALGAARATAWRPRTACCGQCQAKAHPFLFSVLHCEMEGFVHGKAIPDIRKLMEKVFRDARRKVSPFPGACRITRGRQLSPSPRLIASPANAQQLMAAKAALLRRCRLCRSSQNPRRELKFSKAEWPAERDAPRLVHPAESPDLPTKMGRM